MLTISPTRKAPLGQRRRGEVGELDDDDGQREGDQRRAPTPHQRAQNASAAGKLTDRSPAKCDSVAISTQ